MKHNYIIYKGRIIHEGQSLYLSTSDAFFRGGYDVCRTIKAATHDVGVVVMAET